jgi:GTP-binding protein YchF
MVRCFADDNVVHVTGKVDPISDIETVHTELALADLETVDKAMQRVGKSTKSGDKDAAKLGTLLEQAHAHLDQGRPVRTLKLSKEDLRLLKPLCLMTAKAAIYVANVDEHGFENNPLLNEVRDYASQEHAPVVAICAALEAEIADLEEDDKKIFLADMQLEEPGLNRLIRAGYALLELQTFFTAGPKEVRAWTMHKGDTAPQAAGVIHTDFEKGFIRAEVISFEDYIKYKGEHGAKEAGKLRLEGKDYIVRDGDVMHFRFNV